MNIRNGGMKNKMKIKIINEIPVEKKYKPVVGNVYDVTRVQGATQSSAPLFFIEVNGSEVGILASSKARECEVVT